MDEKMTIGEYKKFLDKLSNDQLLSEVLIKSYQEGVEYMSDCINMPDYIIRQREEAEAKLRKRLTLWLKEKGGE